jgi:hypothetical protein
MTGPCASEPPATPPPTTERFIIGGDPAALTEVRTRLDADPQARVVQAQGTAEAPTLIVAEMPTERADRLRAEFADRVVVERDLPLQPFVQEPG